MAAPTTGTPTQRGVSYEAGAARTFSLTDGGTAVVIPLASTYNEKEVANGVESENQSAETDNYSTSNHHLVATGDFKLKTGTSVPNQGDVLWSADSKAWVVTGNPEVKSYSAANGHPILVALELKYWPGVAGEIS